MLSCFITIRFLDVIDILLVSILLYQLYLLIRGTVAIRIFIAVISIYVFWLLVKAMKMELLSSILGQVMGVGMIAIIIVFQQEIRKFLLMLGNRYFSGRKSKVFSLNISRKSNKSVVKTIVDACMEMGKQKTGALIVLANNADLKVYAETGTIIDSVANERLIKSIFFKNSPLHDGAMIVSEGRIYSVGCLLPVSNKPELHEKYGLRHRAALGVSETTDSIVVVVSEENGGITIAKNGNLIPIKDEKHFIEFIEKNII